MHIEVLLANHGLVVRLSILAMLICALIVPRVAWGAHEAGHDQPAAAPIEHVHHGDHSHEVVGDAEEDGTAHDDEQDGGLVHDHLPAEVLSAIANVDNGIGADAPPIFASLPQPDLSGSGSPAAAPDSLLRPPRAA